MILRDSECQSCGRAQEYLFADQTEALCACGGMLKAVMSASQYDRGYARRRFPYYDQSLDRTFQSPQEKATYLRKAGYTQIEGHFSKTPRKKGTLYFT